MKEKCLPKNWKVPGESPVFLMVDFLLRKKMEAWLLPATRVLSVNQSPDLPAVNSNGQGGLLGLTIDPAFSQNRMVYWVFSENVSGGSLTSVAKGKLSADEKNIENAVVIYRATPAYKNGMHYGGRILFDKSGNIWVSTGERSDPKTRPQAQQLNSGYGKVIRITKEGKAVDGNPFSGGERPEIYSYGHRNVQGLAMHPVTGDIWEGEFGPRGGDEINLIRPGKNYGWPIITYGIEYGGSKVGEGISQKEGLGTTGILLGSCYITKWNDFL